MHHEQCPGLPASWPNAWLAALGATVLTPDLRLSWTDKAEPVAVLRHPTAPPADAIVSAWPTCDRIQSMPLHEMQTLMPKTQAGAPSEKFVEASAFRQVLQPPLAAAPDDHSVCAFFTDQSTHDQEHERTRRKACAQSPFFQHGTRGKGTVYDRLVKVIDEMDKKRTSAGLSTKDFLQGTLNGTPRLVACNGLGFDARRHAKNNRPGTEGMMVDPVVEILAFWGLALLPLRGDGNHTRDGRPNQKCQSSDRRLLYPAWRQEQPLDRWGVAALLTHWEHETSRRGPDQPPLSEAARRRLGVTAAWHAEVLRPDSGKDTTRGLSSTRIDMAPQPTVRTERRTLATAERRASVL